MSNLYDKVLLNLDNKDAIHVFGVAVGHIHDVIYDQYGGSISYCDRNNKKVEINLTTEPDGIHVTFHGSRQAFFNNELTTSIYDTVKSDGADIDQDDINEYVDLLEFVNDLLIENNINPEVSWNYG